MKEQRVPILSLILILLFTVTPPLAANWDAGVAAFQAGKYHDAVANFRHVVSRSPESPQGYYMLGLSLLQQRQAKVAIEPLLKAVELATGKAQYRLTLAHAQIKAHDSAAALNTLMVQDPAALPAQQLLSFNKLLARSAGDSDQYRLAKTALQRAIKKSPEEKNLHLALALLAAKNSRGAEEFAALAAAFQLDTSDTDLGRKAVHKAFGLAANAKGEERVVWYLKGAKRARQIKDPTAVAEVALLLGEAEMGSRNYAAARHSLRAAAAEDPGNPLPYFYLGQCALAETQAALALTHLNDALLRSPEASLANRTHAARGLALRYLERFEDAATAYREAGNAHKAAEMERLMAAKAQNAEWEKEKSRCLLRRQKLGELLSENQDLKGTDTWRELEEEHAEVVEICQQFFHS